VYRGDYRNNQVALKTLKIENSSEFDKEIALIRKLSHPNIVAFLGIYKDKEGTSYMVTEYLSQGCAADVIKENKATRLDLCLIALDVASGLEYLRQQCIVHADLALRNVLLTKRPDKEGRYLAKVADFGLSKSLFHKNYYSASNVQEKSIPIRWTAIEVIETGKFSYASDMWAFAVLVWEIFSEGRQPYGAMNNLEVIEFMSAGRRLAKPDSVPDDLYALMLQCWTVDPSSRPSISFFVEYFAKMVETTKQTAQHSYALTDSQHLSTPLYNNV